MVGLHYLNIFECECCIPNLWVLYYLNEGEHSHVKYYVLGIFGFF